MHKPEPIVIIGAGWAGLAAAIELSHNKVPVTLIESNQQLGGRGRTISINHRETDNGQHLLIGAYSETLRLLKLMGHHESDLFKRRPTLLKCRTHKLPGFRLSLPHMPAPIHFIVGLLIANGFSLIEKKNIIQLCITLRLINFSIKKDEPLLSWLKNNKQSEKIIAQFWQPLCLSILNTSADRASCQVFLHVLKDSFTLQRHYSDFLFARHNIGKLFPEPAKNYLNGAGVKILTRERVKKLERIDNGRFAIQLRDKTINTKRVILAVPPKQCLNLTQHISTLKSLHEKLARFKTSPITTVYCSYPKHISLGQDMIGISGGELDWLIDRSSSNQPGVIAAIISGDGPHMQLSKESLADKVTKEIATLYPHWPKPINVSVIREKHATFLCEVGINSYRPENKTALSNMWLAGDYTNTGYPATLEGAVRSGVNCTKSILKTLS
ncbi:MAG: FAD-dependent oxidoreductase [Thiotrichales bacterium]|nr:FAD-dependent oxidoreductase [Thiotrichales bacterium]